MIFFYGIGRKMQFVIMPFSLHFASMMHLAWDLLAHFTIETCVTHSSMFTNLKTMLHTKLGSMGARKSTQWITLWLLIIKVYSST
jgi:hypothetical protein